jgi:hypothetical protein
MPEKRENEHILGGGPLNPILAQAIGGRAGRGSPDGDVAPTVLENPRWSAARADPPRRNQTETLLQALLDPNVFNGPVGQR